VNRSGWIGSAACAAWLAAACAPTTAPAPSGLGLGSATTAAEEAAPIAGVALQQRRERLERLFKDLTHIRRSLRSANQRGDRETHTELARLAGAYLGLHIDPLLAAEWQSEHPELMALDAGLRLAEVELLREMNDGARARAVLENLERRFADREELLVDYPVGEQTSLREALEQIRGKRS
jgi:hypothetical protein